MSVRMGHIHANPSQLQFPVTEREGHAVGLLPHRACPAEPPTPPVAADVARLPPTRDGPGGWPGGGRAGILSPCAPCGGSTWRDRAATSDREVV